MAVYTRVSPHELEGFLRAYDLGTPRRFSPIPEGIENSNFRLETDRGRYVLTLFEKRVREDDLPFFLALMSHLRTRGLPCPRPVPARDGVTLRRLNGRPAAVVTLLPGRTVARPNTAQTREAGMALARLHEAARDFAGARDNDLDLPGWRRLYADCRAGAEGIETGLAAEAGEELCFLERAWPRDLPRGIVHADLFPDNVLYTDDTVTGIIDFYFAASDLLAYDLAVCLGSWCFSAENDFQPAHARALLQGYEAVRPLSPAERDALPVLARGAAMRFLLTRLYDCLHPGPEALVTPKDPLQFLARLCFFRKTDLRHVLA